ncbi:hypothetical protein TeGR_g5138, partial [Tetraparma gracilis]
MRPTKLAELQKKFPGWTVVVPKRSKFKLTDPTGKHSFKVLKAAAAFRDEGVLPVKGKKGEGAATPGKPDPAAAQSPPGAKTPGGGGAAAATTASSSAPSTPAEITQTFANALIARADAVAVAEARTQELAAKFPGFSVELNWTDSSFRLIDGSGTYAFPTTELAAAFVATGAADRATVGTAASGAWREQARGTRAPLTAAEREDLPRARDKLDTVKREREENVLRQFPEGWTALANKNGSYRISDPTGHHTFKTAKEARIFLETGVPPRKLTKKELAKLEAERKREEKKAAIEAKKQAKVDEAQNEAVTRMSQDFPDDWLIEKTAKGNWKFTEPSDMMRVFKTVKDAKAFLESGGTIVPKSRAEQAADAKANAERKEQDAKAVEIQAKFPAGWEVTSSSSKRSFNFMEPTGTFIFRTQKDANAYLNNQELPAKSKMRRGPNAPDNGDKDDWCDDSSVASHATADPSTPRRNLVRAKPPSSFPDPAVAFQHPLLMSTALEAYTCAEAFLVDMSRMFYNCSQYHTSNSKGKVRSWQDFISFVAHCRDFFETLWLEFVLPSAPVDAASSPSAAFAAELDFKKRNVLRGQRLAALAEVKLSKELNVKIADAVRDFAQTPIVAPESKAAFLALVARLEAAEDGKWGTFGSVVQDLNDVVQKQYSLQNGVQSILGTLSATLYEFVTRGELTSCSYCTPLEVVWARENGKRP